VTVEPTENDVAAYRLTDETFGGYRIPTGTIVTSVMSCETEDYNRRPPYWAHHEDIVAYALLQNPLEQSLLNMALGQSHLQGLLSTRPDAETYLKWYDKSNGTNFMPETYTKYRDDLPQITPAQRDRFHFLLGQM
jgi:hypothetical protein